MDTFKNKKVLITGGTGSFGRAMVDRLLKSGVEEIRIFSRDEEKQLDMSREIDDDRVTYWIGDIRDYNRVTEAVTGINYVYHAAALKIIDVGERHPHEAIKTNILGTNNVCSACITSSDFKCGVLISTDKACKPINLYGMTKAVAERVWLDGNKWLNKKQSFEVVRYGNVIGSRGSIVPFFKMCVNVNAPIPITDINMTRFLITLEDATNFVMQTTGTYMRSCGIHVPAIQAARVVDIAKAIGGDDYELVQMGIRPGEKIHECLINEYEIMNAKPRPDGFVIADEESPLEFLKEEYTSETTRQLTVDQIRELIK